MISVLVLGSISAHHHIYIAVQSIWSCSSTTKSILTCQISDPHLILICWMLLWITDYPRLYQIYYLARPQFITLFCDHFRTGFPGPRSSEIPICSYVTYEPVPKVRGARALGSIFRFYFQSIFNAITDRAASQGYRFRIDGHLAGHKVSPKNQPVVSSSISLRFFDSRVSHYWGATGSTLESAIWLGLACILLFYLMRSCVWWL